MSHEPIPVPKGQPISDPEWVPRGSIAPNEYNPNHQAPPEHRLLKVSILADGWTQPIVVHKATRVIVDGEHRWEAAADPELAARTNGLVPVVWVGGDLNHRMMSTIRHNRARGVHAVLPMAAIVKAMLDTGMTPDAIQNLLQMEDEEVCRLAERAGSPARVARGKTDFSPGWVPGTVQPGAEPAGAGS